MSVPANRSPVAIFAYNRPDHLLKTLESLKGNKGFEKHPVFIFSDGPKDSSKDIQLVNNTREIAKTFSMFKNVTVIHNESNHGLAKNIISGVSEVMKSYGQTIVVEDDLILSPLFLDFMDRALEFYRQSDEIFSISGYSLPLKTLRDYEYDIYLLPRCSSWGWASWKDRWDKVDWEVSDFKDFINNKFSIDAFDQAGSDLTDMLERQQKGDIDSWAIRWNYAHFRNNGLSVVPAISLVANGGCDNSGSNVRSTDRYKTTLNDGIRIPIFPPIMSTDDRILDELRDFFNKSIRRKIKKTIRNIF
ncbi:MAG TPA: glycosyltransferase [bacterium]|nr:glycosyltransferase [bacterium]HPS30382.1 glycosyltransferase [bacterium]